jgi:hypothetical protein
MPNSKGYCLRGAPVSLLSRFIFKGKKEIIEQKSQLSGSFAGFTLVCLFYLILSYFFFALCAIM